jgi:hypothetical protein
LSIWWANVSTTCVLITWRGSVPTRLDVFTITERAIKPAVASVHSRQTLVGHRLAPPSKIASVVVINPERGNITLANSSQPRAVGAPLPVAVSYVAGVGPGPNSRRLSVAPHAPVVAYEVTATSSRASTTVTTTSFRASCRFELCVIPLTQAMDEAEAALANALVIMSVATGPRYHWTKFIYISPTTSALGRGTFMLRGTVMQISSSFSLAGS